jgi:hypothetical protein
VGAAVLASIVVAALTFAAAVSPLRAQEMWSNRGSWSDVTTACGSESNYSITAAFINTSAMSIQDPYFAVVHIDAPGWLGNVLQNADGGPEGIGATLTPDVSDGILSPGESTTATFVIGLSRRLPFRFLGDVRGEPVP